MSILKIARLGHPILRQNAAPIDPQQITSPEVQRLIRDMLETMLEYKGVGLAAPQVHQPVRLILAAGDEDDQGRSLVRVLINPEIRPTTEEKEGMWEGCLSIPGMRGFVERPRAVDVEAYNEKGKKFALSLEGFAAVVVQHEKDHLDGVLFVDKLKDTRLFAFEDEAERFLDVVGEAGQVASKEEA